MVVNKVIPKPKVPKLDKFAKIKIKNKKKVEAELEREIIESCKDFKSCQTTLNEVLELKKAELHYRLQERNPQAGRILPVQEVQCSDGFLNLLRNDWNKLNEEEQNDIFLDVLTAIEECQRNV